MGSTDNNRVEMLALEEILPQTDITPEVILEVGSHDGKDAERLQRSFDVDPSNVYVVEAHPTFYSNIHNEYPHYNVFNFAANNISGVVEFHAAKDHDDGRSSVLGRSIYNADNFETVECVSKRMDTFITEQGIEVIDIFKLDVEGLAQQVLEGFGDSINIIKCIQVETEYNQMWEGQKVAQETYDYLISKGFVLVWNYNIANLQNDSIWIRKDLVPLAP
jgi:FkbM family methyltransferase